MSARFEKEPGAPFSFVNPVFDQTCRRNISVFVDDLMGFSKASYQRHVVLPQLSQHVERANMVRIVVA